MIPDTVKITGTVRTFDDSARDLIEDSIKQITASTCEGAGATARVEYTRGYPSVWNHPEETKKVEEWAKLLLGPENVKRFEPMMGADDFSYYLQKVPGTFFFVGGRNPEIGAEYPHHHPNFDVDERSMLNIGALFILTVFDYPS